MGVQGAGGAVGIDGDTAVVLCQMGEDGEIVVLRGAQAVDENDGLAGGCWGASWVGVCVVEAVGACLYEGHFGNVLRRKWPRMKENVSRIELVKES